MKTFNKDSQWPDQDSNAELPEYEVIILVSRRRMADGDDWSVEAEAFSYARGSYRLSVA
jgi:hypothetical protein